MAGVEDELWHIFTFYTLRGNPLDLTRLSVTQFLRLARDCRIVDGGITTIAEGQAKFPTSRSGSKQRQPRHRHSSGLGQAAVNLAFASIIRRREKVASKSRGDLRQRVTTYSSTPAARCDASKSKLTYPEFLDALVVLGDRMYRKVALTPGKKSAGRRASALAGGPGDRSAESAFQQLLMEHILPLASRRRPTSSVAAMRDPLVRDLLRHYAPALRDFFRFYAGSRSASSRKPSSHGNGGAGYGRRGGKGASPASDGEECQQQPMASDLEPPPLPQPADPAGTVATSLPQVIVKSEANPTPSSLPSSSVSPPSTLPPSPSLPLPPSSSKPPSTDFPLSASSPPASSSSSSSTASSSVPALETPFRIDSVAGEDAPETAVVAAAIVAVPHAAAPISPALLDSTVPCPSSTSRTTPENNAAERTQRQIEGDTEDGGYGGGDDGAGGTSHGGGGQNLGRRRPFSAQPSFACSGGAAMNSMADSLSHECLLCFATDFGIAGSLLSTLEVGEVFLSCDGGQADTCAGKQSAGNDACWSGDARRMDLARAGKGGIRPLLFHEFLEALVRLSVACFRPRDDAILDPGEESCCEPIGAGHCLRALLTHIWRRLHDSAALALNGVRAGGTRHRSSIQKGALLKGVQSFNDQMLSTWRNDGFLDFASSDVTTPAAAAAATIGTSRPYSLGAGQATGMLRALLALENTPAK